LPAIPKDAQDFVFHGTRASSRCAQSDRASSRTTTHDPGRVGPPSSAARTLPVNRCPLVRAAPIPGPAANLSMCGAVSSAREQKKTALVRAGTAKPRCSHISAPIVSDDLQSGTLRSPARARFSACQHLLTEGDYRHVRA
jgi:hypothetical protein